MDIEALNDELLEAEGPQSEPEAPKRNSKQSLIDKILEISECDGITLEHSNTKLKRMNKQQLARLCAEMIEKGVRQKMADSVGASDTSETAIALGALRMLHDVCAVGLEKGSSVILQDYGYSIQGFSQNLKEPTVSRAIDDCLAEIARENTELLEYVKSPYTRLMIAWGGAMAFSCRKLQKNVTHLERRPARGKGSLRGSGSGRPQNGKVDPGHPPPAPIKEV
jgi:hypothetical protein